MAQDPAKEEPKGLFTSIFDGVKNAGSSVVDGVGKVSALSAKTKRCLLCGAMIAIDDCTGRTLCRGRREVRWRGCCGWSQGLPDFWLPVPTVLLTVLSSQA